MALPLAVLKACGYGAFLTNGRTYGSALRIIPTKKAFSSSVQHYHHPPHC